MIEPPPEPKRTLGEKVAAACRDWLKQNGKTSLGAISAPILAEIVDRVAAHEKEQAKAHKTAVKRMVATCDEEWIKGLEGEPALEGVDVRGELLKCAFWCKNHNRNVTRQMFNNWLLKADRKIPARALQSPSEQRSRLNPYQEPSWDWRAVARGKWPSVDHDRWEGSWGDLGVGVRGDILRAGPR